MSINEAFPEAQPPLAQVLRQNLVSALQEGTQLTASRLGTVESEFTEGPAVHGLIQARAFGEEGIATTHRLLGMLNEAGTSYFDGHQAYYLGVRLEDITADYNRAYQSMTQGYETADAGSVSAVSEVEAVHDGVTSIINQMLSQDIAPVVASHETVVEEDQTQASDDTKSEAEKLTKADENQQPLIDDITVRGQEAMTSLSALHTDVLEVRNVVATGKNAIEGLPTPQQMQSLVTELTDTLRIINTGNTHYVQDAHQYAGSLLRLITEVEESVAKLDANQYTIRESTQNARSKTSNVATILE